MIRFESTIAACHKYKSMPVEIEGDLPLLRERLRNATGELIGYICKEC